MAWDKNGITTRSVGKKWAQRVAQEVGQAHDVVASLHGGYKESDFWER